LDLVRSATDPTIWKDIIADMLMIDRNGETEIIEVHDRKMKGRTQYYILQKAIHAFVLHYLRTARTASLADYTNHAHHRLNGMDVVPDARTRDFWFSVLTGKVNLAGMRFLNPFTGDMEVWDPPAHPTHRQILGVIGQQRPLITKGEYLLLETINKHAAALTVMIEGEIRNVVALTKFERRSHLTAIVATAGNYAILKPDLGAAWQNLDTKTFMVDLVNEFEGFSGKDIAKPSFWKAVALRMTPYLVGGEISYGEFTELNPDEKFEPDEINTIYLDLSEYYATFATQRAYISQMEGEFSNNVLDLFASFNGATHPIFIQRLRPLIRLPPPS
jgi:hypothetical protein